MAKINLSLPRMDGIESMTDRQAIRRIQSYLYQLNEQLRYELTHIDEDNIAGEGTTVIGLSETALKEAISQQMQGQSIDLSDNELIRQIKSRLEEIRAAQSQQTERIDANAAAIQERVKESTYYGGIGQLRNRLEALATEYTAHTHGISISSDGLITMGEPGSASTNPNIADTAFFRDAVSAARPHSLSRVTLSAAEIGTVVRKTVTVYCEDDEEIDLEIEIDARGQ